MSSQRSESIIRQTSSFLFLFALLAVLASSVFGQTFYGTLVGTVSDSSGAAIPEAKVTLVNTGTQDTRTIESGANGAYQFVNLVPGMYQVSIEKQGFKRQTLSNLQVEVQATLRADAVLQLGEMTQTVEVSGQSPLLQTEQSSLSQAVEGRTVQEMPLNGRNVMNMVALVPGVVAQGSTSGNPMGNQGGGATTNPNGWGNYQIGGGMANQSSSYFDGAPLNVSYVNSTILVPTQDAVQEFRVATNSVSPEFGRFAGGVVNLASKSGTNQLHGNFYEYFRNRDLNANNFFNNRGGIARPAFNQNQYGANAAGPIIKDKTFFMFTWEGFKLRVGIPTVTTVPTAAMRSGDFSAAGIPKIYDPLTVCGKYGNAACPVVNGNPVYTRTPFPNNQIPASRIDPTAAIMNNLWGLPNASGILNNFVTNGTGGGNQYQINTRGDHIINDNQRLFARYSYWQGKTIPNDLFHNKATANLQQYDTVNAVLGYNWSINPTTVADVRLSYIRFVFGFYPPNTGASLSSFGPAYAALQNQVTFAQFPASQVTGMQTFNYVTVRNANNNEALSENITKIMGRHTIKFGAESRRIEWGYGQTNYSSGQFVFTTGFTALNPQAPAGSGYAMASYLLGDAATGQAQEIAIAKQQQWYHGLYVQDTFQVSNKLTVNLGLRWEYPGQFSEAHGAASVFLPTATDPLGTTVGLPLKGLVAPVSSSAYPSSVIHPAKWNLFGPRVGFAYRMDEKTVIRSGYGISFLPNDVVFGNGPWTSPSNLATTVMTTTLDGGITPYATLSNPFPGGLLQPPGHTSSLESTVLGSIAQVPVPNQPAPYTQQWNFTIQRQLPGNLAAELGYAGSKGTHLPLDSVVAGFPYYQADQISDAYLPLGNQLVQQVANPFYGKVPATAGILTQPTVAYGQLLRPYPQYSAINNTSNMAGDSTYHALQAKIEKRFGTGGTFLAAYTWSKLLSNSDTVTSWLEGTGVGIVQDWNNASLDKSLASYNVAQHLVFSYVYDLPFGKGKRYAQSLPKAADMLIGGWSMNGTTTLQSGYPILMTAQPTTLSSTFGGGTPRPNYVGGCNSSISGSAQSRISQWFNTACFTQPGPFAYGNEGRADASLTNQGIANWDVAVAKNFLITERYKLRFETEFFNIANRTQFSAPNTQLGNPLFGIITAVRNQPRLVQFALRLSF